MRRFCLRVLVGTLAVLLSASSAVAQTPTASVEGVVLDGSAAVIPGATVELRDPATNQRRVTITDASGAFRFSSVTPSAYELRIELSGFATHEQHNLSLAVGQTVRLRVTLLPAAMSATVTVSAQPPALDGSQTAVSTVIDAERIEELPVRSRKFLEFALLAPGVARAPKAPTSSTAGLPDSGFSFAGLRPRSNMLTIDGLDNNDEYSGASRTELSLELVREFQVVTNGWSAEHGGASGGAINVVTKSGTNTLHGDTFLFGQSGRFNKPTPLEDTFGARPTLTRYRGGLAIGGPVIKDRTFYYMAAEQEYTRAQRRVTAGLFATSLDETEFSAKVTHQFNERHALMARLAATDTREGGDGFHSGALTDVSARGTSGTRDVALTSTWTTILGSRATNELRGQTAIRRADLSTNDPTGAGVSIAGVMDFGRPYAGNSDHAQTYGELGDTFALARGHHFIRIGGDATFVALKGTDRDGTGGLYLFRFLDAFKNRQPDSFRQVFGDPAIHATTTRAGVFVQDRWTPGAAITIDAGVRADIQTLPAVLDVTSRQISPRVGFAWTPSPKWVVRGGAGTFADRLVLAAFEPALLRDGHRGFEQVVEGSGAAAVLASRQGGPLMAPLPSVAPSIATVRAGNWHSSSRQASIGVDRSVTADLTVSANYLFVRGHELLRTVNVNLPAPTIEFGRPVFGSARLNPSFDGIFELQPTASSTYHGLTVSLNRRLAHEIEWSAAYTWSQSKDSASDFNESPQNPYALGDEWAASRFDQRHRLVASALFDLPIGDEEDRKPGTVPAWWERVFGQIEAAPILTIASGQPVTAIVGADLSRTHAWPLTDRPIDTPRNSLRLPASVTLDLRVLKAISVKPHGKLDLVVEAFNLFNRTNVTQLNTMYGPLATPLSSFGRAIAAGAGRHIQFSIDFEF